jgi:hypothetical protein
MTDGYLLSPATAARLGRLLGQAPPPLAGGPAGGPAPPKLVAWVRATAAGAGWVAGVVCECDRDGAWADRQGGVELTSAGGPLAAGRRYLCQRTGDKADGTPRFVAADAPAPAGVPATVVTNVQCVNNQLVVTTASVRVLPNP